MESLALMAAIIVAISVIGGPIALLLSRKLRGEPKPSYIRAVIASFVAIPAFFTGLNLILIDIGIGGRIVGLVGVVCGSLTIYKIAKWIKELRASTIGEN